MKFTTKALEALPVKDAEYIRFDERGSAQSGWLAIRVRKLRSGPSRQFVFVYPHLGKRRKLTVGEFGDPRNGGMTLKEARNRYEELSQMVKAGKSPINEREAQKRTAAAIASRGTFGALCSAYVDSLKARGARSAEEVERVLQIAQETIPSEKPAADVTIDDIRTAMRSALRGRRRVGQRSQPEEAREQANRMRGYLHSAFAFGLKHDLRIDLPEDAEVQFGLTHNPARDVPKVDRPGEAGVRDIELVADEIALLWRTLGTPYTKRGTTWRVRPDYERALKLILATGGQRVEVITNARWSEIDLEEARWTVPHGRRKNALHSRGAHVLPLNRIALELFKEQRAWLKAGNRRLPEWAFPAARKGKSPHLEPERLRKALQRWIEASEFPKWFAPRDLRQTFKSRGGELGLSKDIRDRIQDHQIDGVSARHYDGYDYLVEKTKALEAWGERLEQIISGANVVPIGSGRVSR